MPRILPIKENEYPLADTEAARILARGLQHLSRMGVSIRELARRMEYKQGTILSHMATGRVPIPVDRAPELAKHLGIDERRFVTAVLNQRHPSLNWNHFFGESEPSFDEIDGPAAELQMIARLPLRNLKEGQLKVMREVAADPNADQRWLSVHELAAFQLMRSLRPEMVDQGISAADKRAIEKALNQNSSVDQ